MMGIRDWKDGCVRAENNRGGARLGSIGGLRWCRCNSYLCILEVLPPLRIHSPSTFFPSLFLTACTIQTLRDVYQSFRGPYLTSVLPPTSPMFLVLPLLIRSSRLQCSPLHRGFHSHVCVHGVNLEAFLVRLSSLRPRRGISGFSTVPSRRSR